MFCPTCRGEYREGIVECPTCHENLVPGLSPPVAPPAARRLPAAANLAMIGTGLIFLIRAIGTFLTGPDLIVARGVAAVYCLSHVAIALFFAVFLCEFVEGAQWRLRLATWASIAGSVAAAVIVALNLYLLFDRPIVSGLDLGVASNVASMLIPVTSVLFFAALRVEPRKASPRLATAVNLALIGSLLAAAAHVVVVAVGLPQNGHSELNVTALVAGAPIVIFAVATWIIFLWTIGREPLNR